MNDTMVMSWLQMVLAILSGLAICIPLVIKLVQQTTAAIEAHNWPELVQIVFNYMKVAEGLFETGAKKKQWVLQMLQATQNEMEYEITDADWAKIEAMIDAACSMADVVNNPDAYNVDTVDRDETEEDHPPDDGE